ncbi:MAG: hypothetical protein NTW87_08270 [Planctomycetota bacterium]|nr:hypothetical protein [Planctomycetota bacterium]
MAAGVLAVAFVLGGCGRVSTQELLAKVENVKTKEGLQKTLGKPDRFKSLDTPLGAVETWTYKASDGEVVFQIVGGRIMVKQAGDAKEK